MLTLLLLRHAKAAPQGYDDDFARALTEKGKMDAARLGQRLAAAAYVPDLALVSAATRTRQTYEIVAGQMLDAVAARFEPALYNATSTQLRDLLRIVDPAVRKLMIVGHNPGIAELALVMARDADLIERERMRNRFSPCSLAVITFDTSDWLDARATGGRLDLFLHPEDLVAPS